MKLTFLGCWAFLIGVVCVAGMTSACSPGTYSANENTNARSANEATATSTNTPKQTIISQQNATPFPQPSPTARMEENPLTLSREKAAKAIGTQLSTEVAKYWTFSVDEVINPGDVGVLIRQGYITCDPGGPCSLTEKGVQASASWHLRKRNGRLAWLEDVPVARAELVTVTGISMPVSPNLAEVSFTWQLRPMNEIGRDLHALHSAPNDQDHWDDRLQSRTARFQKFDEGWRLVGY